MLKPLWEQEPDSVNEIGTKFWFHKELTEYAARPDLRGRSLANIVVWVAETTDGVKSYLVTEDQQILNQTQLLEGVYIFLDCLKYVRSSD